MKSDRIFLCFCLVIGLTLRLAGIQFGSPLVVHPDEHNLLYHAMEAGAQNGNPKWFEYPSGMLYLTLGVQGIRYLVSGADSPSTYWTGFIENPFPYHLWIRVLVAFFGVLGILAIYLLGREWDRNRPAIAILGPGSAFLLAVHFLHIRDSHFATVDIPLTTCVTFVLWLLLREMNRPETNVLRLLSIGLLVGGCCGIKYTAAPLIFPLFYVAFTNVVKGGEVRIDLPWFFGSGTVLLAAVGIGFILTTPYAILDSKQFWEDLRYQWFTSKSQPAIYGGGEPFLLGYLRGPWMWAGGPVLGVIGFFGLMMAVLRHEREDRPLLAFAIPYFLLLGLGERVWGRWFLPLVPLQVLWTVRFLSEYGNHPSVSDLFSEKVRRRIVWVFVAIIGLTTLIPSLRLDILLRTPDTRVLAQEKLEQSLTVSDYPLVTGFLPPLPREIPRRWEEGLLNDRESFAAGEMHRIRMDTLEDLLDEGINKVVYSSFYWEAVGQPHVREAYPGSSSYVDFLEQLETLGREEWRIAPSSGGVSFHPENIYAPTFSLWRWQRPGPEIRLYSLPPEETF